MWCYSEASLWVTTHSSPMVFAHLSCWLSAITNILLSHQIPRFPFPSPASQEGGSPVIDKWVAKTFQKHSSVNSGLFSSTVACFPKECKVRRGWTACSLLQLSLPHASLASQAFWVLLYTVFNACPFNERVRGVLSDIVINKPLAQWSCLTGLSSSSCLFTHGQTHTHTYTHLNNFCRLELHYSLCPCILSSNVYDPFSKACAGIWWSVSLQVCAQTRNPTAWQSFQGQPSCRLPSSAPFCG